MTLYCPGVVLQKRHWWPLKVASCKNGNKGTLRTWLLPTPKTKLNELGKRNRRVDKTWASSAASALSRKLAGHCGAREALVKQTTVFGLQPSDAPAATVVARHAPKDLLSASFDTALHWRYLGRWRRHRRRCS